MEDVKITVINNTGIGGLSGEPVNVMIFQTVLDQYKTESYFSAWFVETVGYPGTLGPISLPKKVQFYVLENSSVPRQSGPTNVDFGQEVSVAQPAQDYPPKVTVTGTPIPDGKTIKVTNESGNAQPLEMALYKSYRKVVSYKDVPPNSFVLLSIKPAIYICAVQGIEQGEDFPEKIFFERLISFVSSYPTKFDLPEDKPEIKIQITQMASGEMVFSEIA